MGTILGEQFEQGVMQLTPSKPSWPARAIPLAWGNSLFIQRGQAIGIVTATGKAAAYASGNSDGTQTCVGLSLYTFNTDATGLVYFAMGSGSGLSGTAITGVGPSYRLNPRQTSPVFVSGVFNPLDLVGVDSTARTNLGIKALPDGDYMIPGA